MHIGLQFLLQIGGEGLIHDSRLAIAYYGGFLLA